MQGDRNHSKGLLHHCGATHLLQHSELKQSAMYALQLISILLDPSRNEDFAVFRNSLKRCNIETFKEMKLGKSAVFCMFLNPARSFLETCSHRSVNKTSHQSTILCTNLEIWSHQQSQSVILNFFDTDRKNHENHRKLPKMRPIMNQPTTCLNICFDAFFGSQVCMFSVKNLPVNRFRSLSLLQSWKTYVYFAISILCAKGTSISCHRANRIVP